MNPSMHQNASSPARCLTPMNNFSVVARSYNISHLDAAIAHLEQVLNLEGANALFSKTYWRGRVVEALATPSLAPTQQARLQRLLDRIASS
jgi:hypothetical protein